MKGHIEEITSANMENFMGLGLLLFSENKKIEFKEAIEEIVNSKFQKLFAYKINNKYIGHIHVSISDDFEEHSGYVGYLEGIGVLEGSFFNLDYDKKEIEKELLKKGEE